MEPTPSDSTPSGQWLQRFPRAIPALLFALAIAATLLAVTAAERSSQAAQHVQLARSAADIAAALQRRAQESVASLNAAAALMGAPAKASRPAFARFAGALAESSSFHGALGMGWVPVLARTDVAAHEQSLRAEEPGYAVFPQPSRDAATVAPVTYIEPLNAVNRRVLGFDMYSEAVRRAAMDRAVVTRAAAGSGKLRLIQDADGPGVAGFIVYMPVYEAATRQVRGFVYSPFRAADFVAAAVPRPGAGDLDVSVYDGAYAPANLLAGVARPGAGGMHLRRPLTIAGRPWVLELTDRRSAWLSLPAQLTLIFGVVLALLILTLARIVTRRAVEGHAMLDRLSRDAAIRTSLTRELNHRVKNTLANVLSIASLTRRRARGLDDFADGLIGRIRALSATHDLLSRSDWTAAPIDRIVRSELAPYMSGDNSQVEVSGPAIPLAPNDAMSLGLAIHELVTNAAKFGALSKAGGKVHVTWRLMAPELAELQWRETGGPAVTAPQKRGFGRDLIEKIVASELRNAVDLEFEPDGVRCRLRVPVRRIGDFAIRQG